MTQPEDPLYARIAASLRAQIADGTLAEGAKLPSERELLVEWATTRVTIANAWSVLRSEGLITSRPGSGTYVRRRPSLKVRSADHYRRAASGESTSPFARDADRAGTQPDWTWDTSRIRSDERVATRLGLDPGDYVMRTTYVFSADGAPVQASTSWEPWAIVGGTPIEEPEGEGQIIGVIARMDSIGIRIDRVTEEIRARPATGEERRTLDIPDDVWVQQIERTHWAGARPVETCDIVIPADRYALRYEISVS